MTSRARTNAIGTVLTFVLAALAALPLVLVIAPAPREALYGDPGDPYGTLAQLEDMVEALDGAETTPRVGLVQPLIDGPAALLARHVGVVAAYDALLILSFPVAAVLGYVAARAAAASCRGAVLAGLLFAYSPWHLAHAREHLDQSQVGPAALVVWAVLLLVRRPGAARALLVVGTLVLAGLVNGYLPLLLLPIVVAGLFAVIVDRTGGRGPALATLVAVGGATIAVGATWVDVPRYRRALASNTHGVQALSELYRYSARPIEYLRPSTQHPLFGRVARDALARSAHGSSAVEQTLTLGYTPIALSLLGLGYSLRRPGWRRRGGLVLVVGATLALWLSLPPELGGGLWIQSAFPWMRAVARFALLVQLVVAVLAGVGAGRLGRPGFAVAVVLCLCEYAYLPAAHRVEPRAVSAFLEARAKAVADYPVTPNRYLRLWRSIGDVAVRGRRDLSELDAHDLDPGAARRLASSGVSHIVIHDDRAVPEGFRVVAVHDGHRVAEVVAPPAPVVLRVRAGFDAPEPDGRWLVGDRGVVRLDPGPGLDRIEGTLVFNALSPARARTLVVRADGDVRELEISAAELTMEVPLDVPEGGLNVVLEVWPPGQAGDASHRRDDPRQLAVLFRSIGFESRVLHHRGLSWSYGRGFHRVEPGGRRWLAGEAQLDVTGLPGQLAFEVTSFATDRQLTIACDDRELATYQVQVSRWRPIRLGLPECASVRLTGERPVRIADLEEVDDDRVVTVAIRALRLEASDPP